MNNQQHINYQRIEKAIWYICRHFREQPSLDEIAAETHLSRFHLQKLFSEWAGVSPKKFMQFLSLEYAKEHIKNQNAPLLNTALATGLSGTSRLHDLFIRIEGMTPGEFKLGGKNLTINFSFAHTPFGQIIIGSTAKGICHLFFAEDQNCGLNTLRCRFPNAAYQNQADTLHKTVTRVFEKNWAPTDKINLHLSGTPFQLKVWQCLLRIPSGALSTYGDIAKTIDSPSASRAVGTAIGKNPIALLIPCHRVIQKTGALGGYMWHPERKAALIAWEASTISAGE